MGEAALESSYTAYDLGQSIVTKVNAAEALAAMVRYAEQGHFDEGQAPKIIRSHFVCEEVLSL